MASPKSLPRAGAEEPAGEVELLDSKPRDSIGDVNQNSGNTTVTTSAKSASKHRSKLSADAIAFQPSPKELTPINFLNHDSVADDHPTIVDSASEAKPQQSAKGKGTQQPIGTRGENLSPTHPRVFFTTDVGPGVSFQGGHYVKIENMAVSEYDTTFRMICNSYGWESKIRGMTAPPNGESRFITICLSFDDLREAAKALTTIEMAKPSLTATYITQSEYATAKKSSQCGTPGDTSAFDGQVFFIASFNGLSSEFTTEGLFNEVKALAASYGEVLAYTEVPSAESGKWRFRVEYYKISDAKDVVKKVTASAPATIGKWTIASEELVENPITSSPTRGTIVSLEQLSLGSETPQKPVNGGMIVYTSPTGRTAWRVDEQGQTVAAQPFKHIPKCHGMPAGVPMSMATPQHRSSAPSEQTPSYFGSVDLGNRSGSWAGYTTPQSSARRRNDVGSYPNNVDVQKIDQGLDVRTTIMLRNLPNMVTHEQLKALLDHHSYGWYDFVYLRIDFQKNSNMGYAFVNFVNSECVMRFANAVVGRPWFPRLSSNSRQGNRIAEISYATVQGKDCCVEKFRNSSVMDENPSYRPKTYYSFDDAPSRDAVGEESSFPPPNNMSKKQRSSDNANHIGLYDKEYRRHHPSAGRSQYDRGTSAQISEDAYYSQMSPSQNGYGYGPVDYTVGGAPMAVAPPPQFAPAYGYGNPYMNVAPVTEPYGPAYTGYGVDPFYQTPYPYHGFNGNYPSESARGTVQNGRGDGGVRARNLAPVISRGGYGSLSPVHAVNSTPRHLSLPAQTNGNTNSGPQSPRDVEAGSTARESPRPIGYLSHLSQY